MRIISPQPRDSQPNKTLNIVTLGSAVPVLVGIPRSAYFKRTPTAYGQLSLDIVRNSVGTKFDSADSDSIVKRLDLSDVNITSDITVITVVNLRTPPSRLNKASIAKWIGYDNGSVNQRSWGQFIDYQTHASDVYVRFGVSSDGSSLNSAQSPTGIHVTNGLHTLVAVYKASSYIKQFLDGKLYGTNTTSIPASIYTSTSSVLVGAQYSLNHTSGNSAYCLTGGVHLYAVYAGAINDNLALSLSKNPWQIFQPDRKSIYYDFGINTPQILRPTSDITTGVNSDIQNYGFENTILTRQPQNPVTLHQNYASIIKSATLCSLPLNDGFDSSKGVSYPFSKSGIVYNKTTISGTGVSGDGSTGYYARKISIPTQRMWIMCSFICNSVSTTSKFNYSLGSSVTGASAGALISIRSGDSTVSNIQGVMRSFDGDTIFTTVNGPVPEIGKTYHCVFVVPTSATNMSYMYVNGVKYTSASSGSLVFGSSVLTNESILADRRGGSVGVSFSSDTILLAAYGYINPSSPGSVGVSYSSLLKNLSKNPWQIFKSTPQIIPYTTPALGWGSTKNIYVPKQKVVSTQPQNLVGIDWSNSITKGLKFATNHSSPYIDLVSKTVGVKGGTIRNTINSNFKITEASDKSSYINWNLKPLINDSSGITLLLFAKCLNEGVKSRAFVIGSESAGQGNNAAQIVFNATNTHGDSAGLFDVCEYQTAFVSSTQSIGGAVDGKFNLWVCRRENLTNTWSIFKNGINVSSGSTGTAGVFTFSSGVRLHGAPVSTTQGLSYPIIMSSIFGRYLTDYEILSLSKNPWQIFKSQEPPNFYSGFGSNLYETIDDPVTDDTDYIQATDNSTCEIKLDIGSRPTEDMLKQLKYRLLPGTGNLTASLVSGSDIIATWDHILTDSPQDITKVLTLDQHQSISEYSDLRIRLTPWQ